MLDFFGNTAAGELLIFVGVFGFLFLMGITPAILKVSDRKRISSGWAIKQPVEHNISNGVGTPIDMLQQQMMQPQVQQQMMQPQVQQQMMQPQVQVQVQPQMQPMSAEGDVVVIDELNGFEHSNVELPELDDNVQVLINTMNEFKEEQLAATKEQIEFLVGEKSAELITSDLRNLSTGEHVICGIFDADTKTIEFDNTFVELSAEDEIRIDSGDFVLVKGHLLPNGTFRVLHWDDPENIEAGYGIEEFKIAV